MTAVLLAGLLLSLAGGAISPAHRILAASPSPTNPPSSNFLLAPGRLVDPHTLPASTAATPRPATMPFLPKDRASFAAQRQLAGQGTTGRRSGVVTVPAAAPVRGAPQTQQKLAGFPVMDLSRQVGLFGVNQDVQPPDTQLAAGPTSLAEAVNSSLSIWSKSGVYSMAFDLNVFFGAPGNYLFTDPRILYDTESGRWFLTGFEFTSTNDSQLYIAVSTTSDPAGTWRTTLVKSQTAVIADQPTTGVNSDKVVISWNDFSGTNASTFSGSETWVLEKSDLVSGAATHTTSYGPDTARFRMVPTQSLTPSTTEWMTYNNPGQTTFGVVAVTGLPSASTVARTETNPAFQPTSLPPSPRQPSGVPVTQAIDDRFLSAVWRNGTLWVSASDACIPAGDSAARACLRLIEISTGGASPTVTQDFDAGLAGIDLYYPAVTLNTSGDLFVSYSESSPSIFPSAVAVDSLAASPMAFENPIVLGQGLTSYAQAPANRWGDYSAAAPDPTNPDDIWVTAEYQASTIVAGNWGTATAQVAIQPSITNVSPNFGPTAGGTSVTINGSHFHTGASVSFASIPATNVMVVNSHQITATTPAAGSSGQVSLTVTNPDGAAGTAASAYTYGSPVVNSVVPSSGVITGGTSVTINGGNFTGATAVAFGATPATNVTVVSDTQITAVSPAHTVGQVDVSVTTPSGTSATTPADHFNYIVSLYFTWYDLASPGMLNDNIHLLNGSGSTANITVTMPGATAIPVTLPAGQETFVSFGHGHIGGPVVINSDQQIQASQRVQYYQTFNEVWAEGGAQASTTSYFNWFDKASPGMLNDNIHLVNPGSASADVSVSLPGLTPQTATIASGAEAYFSFPKGTIGGPITVTSSQPVLATQRVQYYSSFKEVWAERAAQAATTTYLNWYDKASPGMTIDNIHVIDPGTTVANVTVSVPGATDQVLTVPAGGEANVSFPAGTIGGPIVVHSDQAVLASQRVVYYATFNEVWAESAAQAATTSHVTWYDKASPGMFNDNFHILNPGTSSATVTVTLPGAASQQTTVAAGGESFVSFPPGTIGGPATVTSTQPVLASQRVQYYSSFNEIWAA
jgi:IPT/TIG domain-containing protein